MIQQKNSVIHTLAWLTFFSIAMGYLETAVVIYLRKLYYPEGFGFPLTPVTPDIAIVEFWREAATIVMLIGAGIMAGKNKAQRLVFFLYCFAIWDIFYYVFLYVHLGWPASLLTWDILFLIPVPWVGPVLCPVLISLTMIALTLTTVYWQEKGKTGRLTTREKWIFITGGLVVFTSFVWDYMVYVLDRHSFGSIWSLSGTKDLFREALGYVPQDFNWTIFLCGQIILVGALSLFSMRMKKQATISLPRD